MRILITGGAGFIGSHVASAYLGCGHEVAVVDDLSKGRKENIPSEAQFFRVNITDQSNLEQVFADFRPEVVSHHAAQMDIRRSLREPLFDANVNVVGSIAILEASVQQKIRKVIFASSGGAIYGEPRKLPTSELSREVPISHYGVTKLCVERYLHTYHFLYGLEYVVLRYANVFGPRQDPYGEAGVVPIFIGQLLRREIPTIFGDGSKTRDYVFIDDIVRANLLALETNRCGTFNIGRGIEVSDYELFRAISDILGRTEEPHFAPRRPGEVEHSCLNAAAAAQELGWKPLVTLTNGIRRTIEYVRSRLLSVSDLQCAAVGSEARESSRTNSGKGLVPARES